MQISQILKQGIADLQSVNIPHPDLEAEILLLAAMVKTDFKPVSTTKEWILANPNFNLEDSTIEQFQKFIERRQKFEPMAFITNHKEFYGYDFYIDHRVLVPRPESELLVEQTLKNIEDRRKKKAQDWNVECRMSNVDDIPYSTFNILELGTGSGCIIISIIKELQKIALAHDRNLLQSNLDFLATDISQDALDVALKNAKNLKADQFIKFVQSDLFSSLQTTSYKLQANFDLIVANLPYVPSYWLNQSDWAKTLYFEPNVALDGGPEGMDIYQRFFKEVPKYLAKDGTILIECEDDQVDKVLKILKDLNYNFSHQVFRDYNNLQRVIQIDKIKI